MQMNWRVLTAINAAIALVTVSAVIFSITRRHGEHTRTAVRSNPTSEQTQAAEREAKARIEALNDLSQARVDDLGAVPAAELTHLMDRATPDELAALAFKFNEAPTDARTLGGMGVFFQAWTELDPKAALTGAFQLKDITFRKLAVDTVVYAVSPSSASELVAMLTEHPDKDLLSECKNEFLNPLIDRWSRLEPEAASKFMDDLGDTKNDLNYRARKNIAENWGTLDPTAALEWVEKQKDKDFVNRNALYDKMINGWCLKDIAAASAYLREHLDDPAAQTAASTVAENLFSHDPQDATDWISRLPAGEPRTNAERTIANMWSEKEPAAASRWMATLPPNEQSDVVGTITGTWAANNWPEASRWIETLSGDVHDSAISAAMNREGATENDSLTLALSMQNSETRQESIEGLVRNWTYSDAESAEAWVKNSPLSPEEKQHLLSMIEETRKAFEEATSERVIIDH
jgi:hypothetical protein